MVTFGRGSGMNRAQISSSLEKSLPPIAGILLIVAAGGGVKQTLVATVTASGILAPLAATMSTGQTSLLVLATSDSARWGVVSDGATPG